MEFDVKYLKQKIGKGYKEDLESTPTPMQ